MGNFVTAYALLKDFLPTVGFDRVFREAPPNLVHVVPLVTIARYGGADTTAVIDKPAVAVDVFASSADRAEELAEDLRTALRTRLVKHVYSGAVVGAVATILAPQILPWAQTNVWRAGARYQLTIHQYGGIS